MSTNPCPTCGSDCNERDELIKAEREIEKLRAQARLYEIARRMSVQQWSDAHRLNISTGKPFDEIVSDLGPFMGVK